MAPVLDVLLMVVSTAVLGGVLSVMVWTSHVRLSLSHHSADCRLCRTALRVSRILSR